MYLHHRRQLSINSRFSPSKGCSMSTYLVSAKDRHSSECVSGRLKNLAVLPLYTDVQTSTDTSKLFKRRDGCLDMSVNCF